MPDHRVQITFVGRGLLRRPIRSISHLNRFGRGYADDEAGAHATQDPDGNHEIITFSKSTTPDAKGTQGRSGASTLTQPSSAISPVVRVDAVSATGMNVRFAIAVHVLVHLATDRLGGVKTEDIALQLGTHRTHVRQIVASLTGAGMVRGYRGRRGGIGLARPAEEISLLDVFKVFEPVNRSLVPTHRTTAQSSTQAECIRDLVRNHIEHAQTVMRNELRKITVRQIADELRTS